MPIQKQSLPISFGQGLDTKTDPWQVAPGKMLALQNAVFNKGGLLQKRNGYQPLASLPDTTTKIISTHEGNLVAIGSSIQALNPTNNTWVSRESFIPVSLSVTSVVRTSASQSAVDVAISSSGLACVVFYDSELGSAYQVVDSETGQLIVSPVTLPATATNPRVFVLGAYFIITFGATVTATPHLRYIAVSIVSPTTVTSPVSLSSQFSAITAGYDGIVANNKLYVAFDGNDGGGAIRFKYLDYTLIQSSTVTIPTYTSDLMSVVADLSTPVPTIYISFWNSAGQDAFTAVYSGNLVQITAPVQIINNIVITQITGCAHGMSATIFYETDNDYTYAAIRSDYISKITVSQAGVVGSPSVLKRSVGLASKSIYFSDTGLCYLLAVYGGTFQPTYFLLDENGVIVSKLAYQNGGGLISSIVLPQINVVDSSLIVGYQFKDLLIPANKEQGVATVGGIYSQTGINIANFEINSNRLSTSEISSDLHITGGFLSMYDGSTLSEHGFHIWPEDLLVTTSGVGGFITAQDYNYVATYEWTDAEGNLFRSAPSIPFFITTVGATSSNTVDIPTLRLTSKTSANKVRVVLYRWSTAQQIFYQLTSISSPLLNDPSVDSVQFVDTLADSSIEGNVILYTTGGVIENIGAPACSASALFSSRLFIVDSEDENLLWYSKTVIESTPAELSDLLTLFVAPTIGAQSNTGPIKSIAAMDDKLIVFKKQAINYITGSGPDSTGANNGFSDPVFITGTVGCDNHQSVILTPQGLMFQSVGKGIWLLGRDLSTQYIGAPVEQYNSATVLSAVLVPETNQARFTLNTGITLMYDYYYGQWGTFNNIPGLSSTIYEGLHTFVNSFGAVYQETMGSYLDGSTPVLMSLITSWFNLAGLQGFERAYFFYLLARFYSPHNLSIGIAYDYNPTLQQNAIIHPDNFSPNYGSDPYWGSSEFDGGQSYVEQWRVFLDKQKCQAFQLTISESYDSTIGGSPGAGLTLSGLNLVVGSKSSYPRLSPTRSVG